MQATVLEVGMAKKRGRPKTTTGEGPTVRLEIDLVTMGKYLASKEGVPVSRLISDMLRGPMEKAFAKAAPKIDKSSSDDQP